MMWLQKSKNDAIHGVDYMKGILPGHFCGRIHEYQTRNCRVVLWTDKQKYSDDPNTWVSYDELSDREKLTLGEPVFLDSPRRDKLENCKCTNE